MRPVRPSHRPAGSRNTSSHVKRLDPRSRRGAAAWPSGGRVSSRGAWRVWRSHRSRSTRRRVHHVKSPWTWRAVGQHDVGVHLLRRGHARPPAAGEEALLELVAGAVWSRSPCSRMICLITPVPRRPGLARQLPRDVGQVDQAARIGLARSRARPTRRGWASAMSISVRATVVVGMPSSVPTRLAGESARAVDRDPRSPRAPAAAREPSRGCHGRVTPQSPMQCARVAVAEHRAGPDRQHRRHPAARAA